jgi:25S rRNA (adenine2142-N1)-methyltransferase
MPNKKRKRPIPLAPKPSAMTSRKQARRVTTLFHKLTKLRDEAQCQDDAPRVASLEQQIQDMGGRTEYQKASQLSTKFHSTSKWVIGKLKHNGWLYGISNQQQSPNDDRQTTQILEVGAINTELLDASSLKHPTSGKSKFKIHVKAIDIHSMVPGRIQEQDFLTLPNKERFHVIVCSMVLNCVTTPQDRGKMCVKLYHHLKPGGFLFLTIPLFCLSKSAFLTPQLFEKLLGETGVGFTIKETKKSPRIAFFILQRPLMEESNRTLDKQFTKHAVRRKGKKFPNQFSVVLKEKDVLKAYNA